MQKTVLNGVYDLLKKIGVVDNESEFSRDWLAHSKCYIRTLHFKQANPSVGAKLYVQVNFSATPAVWRRQTHMQSLASSLLNLANSATHK
jgi:hypothetical protein